MIYHFERGTTTRTLVLLHGTGGNQFDLLALGRHIDGEANVLSFLGDVREHGQPRFFKRLAEGVFDLADLTERTTAFWQQLQQLSDELQLPLDEMTLVGYSNGANFAGSLLYEVEALPMPIIFFHPMVPRRDRPMKRQGKAAYWISAGQNDPICPAQETEDLAALLQADSDVTVHWTMMGHQLTMAEVDEAKQWYERRLRN